uniref:Helix-turn-helix XRE-family like protein n=1 Tax=Siphoviridae sp. ctFgp7 TaxID=2827821 RepID=A0A8S5SSS8_9CAUD|nr:MAG TPA: Helix-turn-helix XRE-family like protein [Siphoviridae sp. ctFgp7]
MKIDEYLKQSQTTQAMLASRVGVSVQAVSLFCHGERIPRPETMRKIYVATNGAVTPNDFYGLPDGTLSFGNPPSIGTEGDDVCSSVV